MKNAGPGKPVVSAALTTGLLLLIPLSAMQFTDEVNWGPADFLVAGLLLFGAQVAHAVAASRARNRAQRVAISVAVLSGLALVWAELAVGLFG